MEARDADSAGSPVKLPELTLGASRRGLDPRERLRSPYFLWDHLTEGCATRADAEPTTHYSRRWL